MISAVIQAGGRSQRMGGDKGVVALQGRPLVEHLLERLEPLADEVVLITNQPRTYRYLNVPLASDSRPYQGAAFGLMTALQAAKYPRVILAAVDMPLVSPALYALLLDELNDGDLAAAIPVWQGFWQPFHGVYAPAICLPDIQKQINRGVMAVKEILTPLSIKLLEVTGSGDPFCNLNSPADVAALETKLADQE